MQIAIVSATEFELAKFNLNELNNKHNISFHAHGIGLLASTFHLTEIANKKPNLIIQCGIAGAFNFNLKLTETVIVQHELLGDTGVENNHENLDLFDLNYTDPNEFPFTEKKLTNNYVTALKTNLKKATSLTVNLASGKKETISTRKEKYQADIESMEGAALHYVCLKKEIPFIQFRGISNFVEPRNKENWKIEEAIESYTNTITEFIHQIPSNL